jgi:hypothetical protein
MPSTLLPTHDPGPLEPMGDKCAAFKPSDAFSTPPHSFPSSTQTLCIMYGSSPSRTGPFTFLMMSRSASRNFTRTCVTCKPDLVKGLPPASYCCDPELMDSSDPSNQSLLPQKQVSRAFSQIFDQAQQRPPVLLILCVR